MRRVHLLVGPLLWSAGGIPDVQARLLLRLQAPVVRSRNHFPASQSGLPKQTKQKYYRQSGFQSNIKGHQTGRDAAPHIKGKNRTAIANTTGSLTTNHTAASTEPSNNRLTRVGAIRNRHTNCPKCGPSDAPSGCSRRGTRGKLRRWGCLAPPPRTEPWPATAAKKLAEGREKRDGR